MVYLTIQKQDGTEISTEDIGFRLVKFEPSAPALRTFSDQIDSRPGLIDMGSTYEARSIEVEGTFYAFDAQSFPLYRDRIYESLTDTEPLYIIDSRQPWKRWEVKPNGSWGINQMNASAFGRASLSFQTNNLPFAESVPSTLEERVWKDNGWWWGMGISWDNYLYTFNTTNFTLENFGNVPINPRYMELVIKFSGASTNLKIRNATTGDTWQYFGTSGASDEIILNGIRSLKNDISIVRNTNLNPITLAAGANQFVLEGTGPGPFTVSFEFRFYWR